MTDDHSDTSPADESAVARPSLIVFDVNETLSDMSPIAARFDEVGLPGHFAATWFAALLRDGFALTVVGANPSFADLATDGLRTLLEKAGIDADDAIGHIMGGFAELPVHPDVVDGIRTLDEAGLRLVTLSNGATSVAEGLFERNGIGGCFERLLSVQDAPSWKPAAAAYHHALDTCKVEAADAMLVAVHPWDVHGAREAGLATAWVNRSGSRYPQTMHRADLEVSSLTELARALPRPPHH